MSLQLIEGFDYLDITLFADKYTLEGIDQSIDTATLRHGTGSSFRCHNESDGFTIDLPTGANEVYVGFAFRYLGFTLLSTNPFLRFIGESGFRNGDFSFSTDGDVIIRNTSGSLHKATDTNPVVLNTWYYIEIKFTVTDSSSAGDVEIKVHDGAITTTLTCDAGVDFKSASNSTTNTTSIRFFGTSNSSYYIDDLYICDSSGSVNNTYLGDSRVLTNYPDADGNANDFDGSDGNSVDNFDMVNEATADDDTTYVDSSTVSEKDQYGFDGLAVIPDDIFGVEVVSRVKKDDAGAKTAKLITRSGGVDYEGTAFSPTVSYDYYSEVWEEDPDTSTAWTSTGVNAAEFGIKVES